jgi:hypothetical protein
MAPAGNLEKIFGWFFKRKEPDSEPLSFAPRDHDDGAAVVSAAGASAVYLDLDGSIRSEVELINRYRSMEQVATVDIAIDEIVNEVVASDDRDDVKIVLDDIEQNDVVKLAIEDAFNDVLELLDFKNNGYNIFKRWYIDGRIYFHVIIDPEDQADGIQELRYIDPRKIRKIREVIKTQVQTGQQSQGDAVLTATKNEYFVFSDKGFNLGAARPLVTSYPLTGLKIAKDAIVHITSGLSDAAGTMTLSMLHKAIKPLNMFATLKDAAVIYRLSRAPERRVWKVYTGNLPAMKAQAHVKSMMDKYRTKINYDATTGEIRDDRRFMTMLEDFWIPVNSEGKGTQVDVLPPGTGFNQIDDILFFQKELYLALHVPVARVDTDNQFIGPQDTAISRDEIKFGKFIGRVRRRFNKLFITVLKKQLVLKNVMAIEEFEKIEKKIGFQYTKDNFFEEAKDKQVETMRWTLIALIAPYVGRYVSDEWVRKRILMQNDEDMAEIDEQIMDAAANPQYQGMPGQPAMEEGGGEGEDQGDGDAGMLVDPNQVPGMPAAPAKANGAKKPASAASSKKPGKKKPGSDFKSVSKMLSKNQ